METNKKNSLVTEKIKYYFRQPEKLPVAVDEKLNQLWGEDNVVLYALSDLSAQYRLTESWLVLGRNNLALAVSDCQSGDQNTWRVRNLSLNDIGRVRVISGLSSNRLVVFSKSEEVVLEVNYSQRQRKAMNHIVYVLERWTDHGEKILEGKTIDAEETYQDSIYSLVSETQNAESTHRMAVVWRLLKYLKPYRRQVAIGMTGAALLTLVSLLPAYLTGYVFDHVIKPSQNGTLGIDQAKNMAFLAVGGLVFIYVLREAFAWVRLRWMAVLGELVARDLRREVYTHLHKLSLSFFSSKQTGSLISRVGSDTDRIWDFVAFGVVEVASSLLMLSGLAFVLVALDWKLGLIVVLPVPFLLWTIAKHGEVMQQLFLRAWRKWSDLTDVLSDTIPGIRVVKAFNQEEREKAKFNQRNETVVAEFNRIHQVWTSFWPKLMLSIHALVIAVWFFGVPRVLEGSGSAFGELSAGTFVAFVLYLTMFVQPIEVIGQMARMVNRATSSAHRVFEVLDTKPQLVELKQPVKADVKGLIEFDRVQFSYDGVRPIIKEMSFQIQPGEFIGLVGPSGGGKTTITNLMTRFYDPSGGQIRIDGIDVKNLELSGFREQVGMVLQDPYLFHGTVLDNIRYAKPQAGLEEVVAAAKAAHAHDFIMKLTHCYDTIVGERGHTLSGGERQRVSIARAILRNPKVLILDEATSAVDTETENKIQEAMDRLVAGRTVIAIAHRLSTLRRADRLFVVKDGELIESGRHQELLNIEDGIYARLYGMQQKMHEAYVM